MRIFEELSSWCQPLPRYHPVQAIRLLRRYNSRLGLFFHRSCGVSFSHSPTSLFEILLDEEKPSLSILLPRWVARWTDNNDVINSIARQNFGRGFHPLICRWELTSNVLGISYCTRIYSYTPRISYNLRWHFRLCLVISNDYEWI